MALSCDHILPIDKSPENTIPYYVRIFDVFFKMLDDGLLEGGQRLPGENLLANHWGVSRGTVRDALRRLEEDGFLLKVRGKGTLVASRATNARHSLQWCNNPCLANCKEEIIHVDLAVSYEPCGLFMSQLFGKDRTGTLMAVVDTSYYTKSAKAAFSVSMIPLNIFERCNIDLNNSDDIKEFVGSGLYQHAQGSQIYLSALSAEESDHERLGIKLGDAIIFMEETLHDDKDTKLGFLKYYLRGDYYRIPLDRRQKVFGESLSENHNN